MLPQKNEERDSDDEQDGDAPELVDTSDDETDVESTGGALARQLPALARLVCRIGR